MDTSAIIDLFKGSSEIKKFLEKNKEPLCVNILSYAELMFGIKEKQHQKEEQYYDEFFNEMYSFDLSKESCKLASKINNALKKEGKTIGAFDIMIVSIFLSNGVTSILTKNKKHFEQIKNLKVISY